MRLGAVVDPTQGRRDKAFSHSKQPAKWETPPTPLQLHLPWAHWVPRQPLSTRFICHGAPREPEASFRSLWHVAQERHRRC